MVPLVELRDLDRSFREGDVVHRVLAGACASIDEGEMVILLGRSGSGKSTLLNLLGGIDLPDAGEVRIEGRALHLLSDRERTLWRRRSVGFVFQFFNLIPTLTVEENLLLPLELLGARPDRAARRRARDLLAEVGLAERRSTWPDRLSGGEQQRVAIARALIHEPRLVLADEPTGNLDAETGQRVLALLDRLVRRRGRTMVMATHSREMVGLADRVLTIEGGRLVEAPGTAEASPPGAG